jgi:hypothetical protein
MTKRHHPSFQLAITALAAVIGLSLLIPAAARADSSLEEIYAALRPDGLRTATGATAFSQGDFVEFTFDLVNTSDQPLVIPLTNFFGTPFHLVGTEQAWLERLGPDPTIPSIPPIIGRKGTWYAAGGAIIAIEGLPGNTIPAGGRVPRGAAIFYPTDAFPTGRYRFHVEYKPLFGGLFDVIATVSLDITFGDVPDDETPPVITVPSSVVANATSPDGAAVSYAASAVDEVDGPVAVDCSPPPGTLFEIGSTQVTCTASDAAGNAVSASFDVYVKGASEQLEDLIARVAGLGPGTSMADKLALAMSALAAGNQSTACEKLGGFANEAQAQSGKKLTAAQAAELVASANRIRAVLAC